MHLLAVLNKSANEGRNDLLHMFAGNDQVMMHPKVERTTSQSDLMLMTPKESLQ